jgi:hypothetical protein
MRQDAIRVEASVDGQKFYRDTTKTTYESREDVLDALASDKSLAETLKYINDAIEASIRTSVRQDILKNEAADAVAMDKSIKDLQARRAEKGKPVTRAQARKIIEFTNTMEV